MRAAAQRSYAPGALLGGRVRLVRPIASGGMGEVWLAINEATGAEIAAKVWRARGDAKATRERFTHEAQLGAKLAHRSIVRVYDLMSEADGTLVLLMELLRGETIEERLTRGPIPAREAIAIVVPILGALQHAHDMGVVHRDVKPANVFLAADPDGTTTPKLVDFGIAKVPAAGNHTVDGHVLGTPRYMSPEHIRGKTDLDGRSDMFSVAAVLYEMLTGRAAFNGATPSATLAAVLEHEIDPDPAIDPRLWREIARALAKRPYERHRNAAEFAAALCTAVGVTETELAASLPKMKPPPLGVDHGSVDLVSEVPTRTRDATTSTRRRAHLAWIVIAACALGIGVVILATRSQPSASAAASATASATTSAPAATASASVLPPIVAEPVVSAAPPPPPPPRATAQTTPIWPRPTAPPQQAKPVATKPGF